MPVSSSSRRIRSARRRWPAARLAAPAAQVDAAQHDLAIAPAQAAHLLDHLLRRRAAAAPAHERNDAERAAVVAAVLDLQIGARAVARGVLHRRGEEIVLRENIADVDVAVVRRGARPVRRSGSCANCPPPIRRPAWPPIPPARAARNSRSPECAPRDSRDARGGWSGARLHPRPGDGAGVEHHQVGAAALAAASKPWPQAAFRARRHRPAWPGNRSFGRRSYPPVPL